MKKIVKKKKGERLLLFGIIFFVFLLGFVLAADPVGPDTLDYGDNESKVATSALMVNISGGVISNFNLTATVQNPRWKAFVGEVIGSFTLDDSFGSTIYDWTLATITGRVYATRTSGTLAWSSMGCADAGDLNLEDASLVHTNPDDNITSTFSAPASGTHDSFYVGANPIAQDSCPTLNTYANDAAQDNYFEEMILHDGSNMVFATILEEDQTGYNGDSYDFQMIVPENGSSAFTGSTPYYLYVEIGN